MGAVEGEIAPGPARADTYSPALARLVLTRVEEHELVEVIEREAERIARYACAVLWYVRTDADGRLVLWLDGAGGSPQLLRGSVGELSLNVATVPAGTPGLLGELVEASFPSSGPAAPRLAVPLHIESEWVGLILLECPGTTDGSQQELDAFARQASAALLVHRSLKRTERHESQLELLNRAFADLSSRFDLDELLLATIARARDVLRAPIGYVMLLDSSVQEIYMRATSGTSTEDFRRLRLAVGAGLGGSVLQARKPFFTSDYLADDRFDHVADVDNAVRKEGIRSITGAPMFTRGEFVGVLFIAHRTVREPVPDDNAVLTRLSQYAALAIETARLRDRDKAALRELRSAMNVVSSQNDQLRRADEAHRWLNEALLAGEDVDGIMAAFAEQVPGFAVVLDRDNAVIAVRGEPCTRIASRLASEGVDAELGKNPEVSRALRELARAAWSSVRDVDGGCSLVAVPIIASGEVIGSLWVELEEARINELRLLIEQAALAIALELMRQRSVAEAELWLHREFLDDLLAEAPSRELIAHRAGCLDIDLEGPIRVCVVSPVVSYGGANEADRAQGELTQALQAQPWCRFAAERMGSIVAIIEDGTGAREALPKVLQDVGGRSVRAVLSDAGLGIVDFGEAYRLAQRLLAVEGSVGPAASVLDLSEARALALLVRNADSATLRTFVHVTLGPVLELDPAGRGDLVRTLEVYLASGGRPSRAAAELNVHVNTLYYRLDRLRKMLGPSFSSMPRSMDIHLACIAWRLLFSTTPDGRKGPVLPSASIFLRESESGSTRARHLRRNSPKTGERPTDTITSPHRQGQPRIGHRAPKEAF